MDKLSDAELQKMNSKDLSKHLDDITQTDICKDSAYCKKVVSEFINKPLTYPMDYEEWLKQPKTKEALKIIKADFDRLDSGQLELF